MRLLFVLLLTSSCGIAFSEDLSDVVGAAVAGAATDQTFGRAVEALSKNDMKMPGWLEEICGLFMLAFMLVLPILLVRLSG